MSLIDQLVNLHRVDSMVRGLRSRLSAAEKHLEVQDKQLATLQRQRQELDSQRKQLQAKIAALELEAKTLDERIATLRSESESTSSHKVHAALLNELATVKADRSGLDDRMLADMEQLEKLKAEGERLDAATIERQKLREVAARQLEESRTEVNERLAQLRHEHEEAVAAMPAPTLELFQRIADLHDGEALAQIDEIDRRHREYACSACNMHLPFETVSRLMAPGGAVVQCGSCHRILYLQQETRVAIAKK